MSIPASERDIGETTASTATFESNDSSKPSYDEQTRQAVDKCFQRYALDGHLYRRGFVRCLRRLGLRNRCLADRFFDLCDRRLRQFLDQDDFQDMFRTVLNSTAAEKDHIVFTLLATDGSGYITRSNFDCFVAEFFSGCRARNEESTLSDNSLWSSGAKDQASLQTVFGSLRTIMPGSSTVEYSNVAQKYIGQVLNRYEQKFVDAAFRDNKHEQMFFDQFCQWNHGRAAFWLATIASIFVVNLARNFDAEQQKPSTDTTKSLRQALENPDTSGILNAKIKKQKQPRGILGGVKEELRVAPPSCKFSKLEVKTLQVIFDKLSTSGEMSIVEWRTFFDALNFSNSYAVERLFSVFDTSEDKQISSKEFLWGLSTICHGTQKEQMQFSLKFYDLSEKFELSRGEFYYFLKQFRSMADNSVRQSLKRINRFYGVDTVELQTSAASIQKRRALDLLYSKIEHELDLYCADVWACFGLKSEASMPQAIFIEFVKVAPAVNGWLSNLGSTIKDSLKSCFEMSRLSYHDHGDEDDLATLHLSEYKMIEAFDRFACPGRTENGDRTLLTLRTTSYYHVLAGIDRLYQTTSSFPKAVNESAISTELHVDMNLAMLRPERYYDIQATVNVSASYVLSLGPRFTHATAVALGCEENKLWILDSIIDGGPACCFAKLRVLGTQVVGKSKLRLNLFEDGRTGAARSVELSIIDAVDEIFTMNWRSSEVKTKIGGVKGLRQTLARALGRDPDSEHDVWINVADTGRSGRCRVTVSVTREGENVDTIRAQVSSKFRAACTEVGLPAKLREEPFHVSVISLSNMVAQQFATSMQMIFKKTLSTKINETDDLVDDLQIIATAWPSPNRTQVQIRYYAGDFMDLGVRSGGADERAAGSRLTLVWKQKLVRRLHKIVYTGELASDLRNHLLDIEVGVDDSVDSVFSLKTEFVQSMKKNGYWQSLMKGIQHEYEEHLRKDDYTNWMNTVADDDDDGEEEPMASTCDVIAGTMNEQQFVDCLRSMEVSNVVFARSLFRVFDADRSGTIEVGEFLSNFTDLYEGTIDDKMRFLYSIHSRGNNRGVTRKSMRLFVRSHFSETENACRELRQQLDAILSTVPLSNLALRFSGDRYVVVKRAVVRKTCDTTEEDYDYADLSSKDKESVLETGETVSALESRQVGGHTRIKFSNSPEKWTSLTGRNRDHLLEPRMDKGTIAVALQKNFANEIDWHVESLVNFAMKFSKLEKESLQLTEFSDWVQAKTTLIYYLESIVKPWLVPASELHTAAGFAQMSGPQVKHTVRSKALRVNIDAMRTKKREAQSTLNHVITEQDVGKKMAEIIHSGGSVQREQYPPDFASTPAYEKNGGLRWARAFTIIHRSEAVTRYAVRPRTHFDMLTFSDIEFAFNASSAKTTVYKFSGNNSFSTGLQLLGLHDTLLGRRVFDMFAKQKPDVCPWCGQKYQHDLWKPSKRSVVFGLMLLAKGPRLDLYHRVFNIFESAHEGRMTREAFYQILGVLQGLCTAVLEDTLDRVAEVLGPEPITRQEETTANEFKTGILARASCSLDAVCSTIFAEAFSKWSVRCWHIDADDFAGHDKGHEAEDAFLTRSEFVAFVRENTRMSAWVDHVGNACLAALASSQHHYTGVLAEASVPNCARRVRHKYPLGTHFERLTSENVRRIFEAHSVNGKISPEQFSRCLNGLHIRSTYTIMRLFRLFDSDDSGSIEMHEFASSFFLVCSGSVDEKLQKAFAMCASKIRLSLALVSHLKRVLTADDADASGFLEPLELMSMLKSFSIIGLDAVGSSMAIVADILGDDATIENEIISESRERIERYAKELAASALHFCHRDSANLCYSDFIR